MFILHLTNIYNSKKLFLYLSCSQNNFKQVQPQNIYYLMNLIFFSYKTLILSPENVMKYPDKKCISYELK